MKINRCFEIIEISADATYEEAKASYKLLVQVWHPDKYSHNKNLEDKATEKFKELQNAWNEIDTYFKSGVARNATSRKNPERTNDNQEHMRKEAAQSSEDEKQNGCNIIICMRCTTKNRVPLGKEATAKCGNCGNPLISSEIKTVRRKALSTNYNNWVNCPYCSDEFPVPQWGDLSITCPKCNLKYKVQ